MNIFEKLPINQSEEIFEEIFKNNNIKIERIISIGQSSQKDFWYNQNWNEWVIVLKGSALIRFENEEFILKTGDYLNIPKNIRHRVEWTDEKTETIWLAIHYN